MPRIRRRNLPRALFRHLVERVQEREITTAQLEEVFVWIETEPEVAKLLPKDCRFDALAV